MLDNVTRYYININKLERKDLCIFSIYSYDTDLRYIQRIVLFFRVCKLTFYERSGTHSRIVRFGYTHLFIIVLVIYHYF